MNNTYSTVPLYNSENLTEEPHSRPGTVADEELALNPQRREAGRDMDLVLHVAEYSREQESRSISYESSSMGVSAIVVKNSVQYIPDTW